jgi:tetratricopeptide (TPR) repeat protein
MPNVSTTPTENSSVLAALKELFSQCRALEETHDIGQARKLEKRAARMVAQIATAAPQTSEHAEALSLHEYVLLSLARTSKRRTASRTFTNAAYVKGAASVEIQLGLAKPGLGAVFAAYNLAIDLISTESRPQEGLGWMLKADALLTKLAGKKKLPRNILDFKLFNVRFGIAKAHYHLGDKKKARTILKRSLALAPELKGATWQQLRDIARSSELLAQIYLDELTA